MAQPNWWEADPVVGGPAPAAPAYPGVIAGRPKTPPPPTAIQLEDQQMDRERLELARQGAARADATSARAAEAAAQGTESERTAGFLTKRIVDAATSLSAAARRDRSALSPTLGVEAVRTVLGDTPANYLTDADRQVVRANQIDILDAALTLGTGAAYNKEQLEGYREAYFPQLGDDPATIEAKNAKLRSLLESARIKAGKAAPDIDSALAALDALSAPPVATGEGEEWTAAKSLALWGRPVFDDKGNPLGPDGGMGYDAEGNEIGLQVRITDDSQPTEAERIANDPRFAEPDAAVIARQGFTMGLSDEAAGIGGAISNALMLKNPVKGYQLWNSVEDEMIARARKNLGWAGTAIEVGSGFGGVGSVGGALTRLTTGQAARQGAKLGALGGFGYGEGLEGSTINAVGGAALGGALGGGAQALGNALARPAGIRAALVDERGARALELSNAGAAEGVTVNRAMVDPTLRNRVTGADATIAGGRRIQRGMEEIEGQIEGRVSDLGQGGNAMDRIATGDKVRQAGERFIERSGKSAKRKYDRAERLAGDARVEPRESLRRVDEMIATLGETASTNQAEISFLQSIREDLSKDLSVGALRRMRTQLRKRISRGELVFGEDEARVLSIMDGAADDIRSGLIAQGKEDAARAFDTADKAYRARMEYITGTVQKLLGKRGANQSPEQIAAKFQSMTRTDAQGLRRFYATLAPDEAADVSATFAEQIGRNNKGEFSVAHFLSQTAPDKLSDEALRTVFGPQGAQSVKNLRVLGREVLRVTGAMNSRTSKTGVANNYKDWLINGLLGATATGGAAMGGGATAIAGGAAVMGANALRNSLSARALMSPNITKWIRQAPSTTNPRAIDQHFARLGDIAKAEPALAGDIEILRNAIMNAANDNPAARLAAQDEASAEQQ